VLTGVEIVEEGVEATAGDGSGIPDSDRERGPAQHF
jgi:hypothetical protein